MPNFMKIRPVEPSCSMQTGGQTDITKVTVGFPNFANAPQNLNERHQLRDVSAEGKVIPELILTTSMFRTKMKLVSLSVFFISGIIGLDILCCD